MHAPYQFGEGLQAKAPQGEGWVTDKCAGYTSLKVHTVDTIRHVALVTTRNGCSDATMDRRKRLRAISKTFAPRRKKCRFQPAWLLFAKHT